MIAQYLVRILVEPKTTQTALGASGSSTTDTSALVLGVVEKVSATAHAILQQPENAPVDQKQGLEQLVEDVMAAVQTAFFKGTHSHCCAMVQSLFVVESDSSVQPQTV